MKDLPWPLGKIINVANELQRDGSTCASTGEQIAAAFVLNDMTCLPASYPDVVEAWERLDDWQIHVHNIRQNYMYLIEGEG